MKNEENLRCLFQNIQNATEITYRSGELESLLEEYSCIGCSNNCQNKDEGEVFCEDCYKCGCSKCATNCNFDCDWLESHDAYKKDLEKTLVKKIQESFLGAEKWASVLSVEFIRRYFPYSKNKEIWKKYVFQDGVKEDLPKDLPWENLIDSEKYYFYSPQETEQRRRPYNYNILRIMAGLKSIKYSN